MKPPCGHFLGAFSRKSHVEVDVVENGRNEQQQHHHGQCLHHRLFTSFEHPLVVIEKDFRQSVNRHGTHETIGVIRQSDLLDLLCKLLTVSAFLNFNQGHILPNGTERLLVGQCVKLGVEQHIGVRHH